jgi:hypothetical protein
MCSGETVAAHWVDEPVAEASASRSSDVIHALADEPYSGF